MNLRLILLSLPAFLFRQIVWLRGVLFDLGIFRATKMSRPVISVGNITVGGTGKTPFSIWLMQRIQSRGWTPGFVSRGYKSAGREARSVTHPDPKEFGDEPSLVRERVSGAPVYVGVQRSVAIRKLLNESPVDVVIADDAFQHRRLKRELDIVLLDALEPSWHYHFLPAGRARESFSALSRAQVIVISKANLADAKQMDFLFGKLRAFAGLKLKMNYKCGGFRNLHHRRQSLAGGIYLVSGVGRPESVEALLPSRALQHNVFPDHHDYSADDVAALLKDFRKSGAENLVTTAKDAIKLNRFKELRGMLWEMELSVDVEGDLNELDRQIDRMVRLHA
jgi:tetraacyldisaccharide 4'-kinase